MNLELVTFPAVPRRGAATELAEAATSPPRATSPSRQSSPSRLSPPSRLRGNEARVAAEVPRSSVSKATRNEVSRPSSLAVEAESLSNSEDKRVRLPTRFEEEKEVEERKAKPDKKQQ